MCVSEREEQVRHVHDQQQPAFNPRNTSPGGPIVELQENASAYPSIQPSVPFFFPALIMECFAPTGGGIEHHRSTRVLRRGHPTSARRAPPSGLAPAYHPRLRLKTRCSAGLEAAYTICVVWARVVCHRLLMNVRRGGVLAMVLRRRILHAGTGIGRARAGDRLRRIHVRRGADDRAWGVDCLTRTTRDRRARWRWDITLVAPCGHRRWGDGHGQGVHDSSTGGTRTDAGDDAAMDGMGRR